MNKELTDNLRDLRTSLMLDKEHGIRPQEEDIDALDKCIALSELDKSPDVGGGKTFTEEQVKAIVKDFMLATSDPGSFIQRKPHVWITDWIKAAQKFAMTKHGITL